MLYPLSYMGTPKMFRFYTNKLKQMPSKFLSPCFPPFRKFLCLKIAAGRSEPHVQKSLQSFGRQEQM